MKFFTFTFTFTIILMVAFLGCTQKKHVSDMTSQDWLNDLNYLDNKIDKEFNSFNPAVKDLFASEIKLLKEKLPQLESSEISFEIMRLMAMLDDGHTELNISQEKVGFHRLPLTLYFFEGELHILAAHENQIDLIGGKILNIGNYTMEQAFKKLKVNMSRDNKYEYIHAGPGYIILTELMYYLGVTDRKDRYTLKVQLENGEIISREVKGIPYSTYNEGPWKTYNDLNNLKTPMYLSNRSSWYWYQYLPESKMMYISIKRVNNQKGQPSLKKVIKQMFNEIDKLKSRKLVIDFRLNNGGNYNKSRPLINGIKKRDWLNQDGKVFVITGRRTFSASSIACLFLMQETNAVVVGEPGRTHPNKADNNEYMSLPVSDFLIEYTTRIKKHWPENPTATFIPVDVEIVPTFSAYSQGRDKVLEYIIDRVE